MLAPHDEREGAVPNGFGCRDNSGRIAPGDRETTTGKFDRPQIIKRRPRGDVTSNSNGSATSVDGDFGAANETVTIRCQKHNGLSNLVGCTRATRRRLGGRLLQPFTSSFPSRSCLLGLSQPFDVCWY